MQVMTVGSTNVEYLLTMNQIGIAILSDAFKNVNYYFHHSNNIGRQRLRVVSDSLAFIQGTGLELVMEAYHVDYNPDNLRNTFFSMIHVRQYIDP